MVVTAEFITGFWSSFFLMFETFVKLTSEADVLLIKCYVIKV